MALTKLTKHIVHGATIVQVRYKDMSDMNFNNSGTENNWDSLTITPQYSDSVIECHFSGTISQPTAQDSARVYVFLDVNGVNEYFINDVCSPGDTSFSFNQFGQRDGASVNMYHRHQPGTTNLQTFMVQVSKDNTNNGATYCYDGFIVLKEIAGGITSGTPGNRYTN